jgi:hypothetical protein
MLLLLLLLNYLLLEEQLPLHPIDLHLWNNLNQVIEFLQEEQLLRLLLGLLLEQFLHPVI